MYDSLILSNRLVWTHVLLRNRLQTADVQKLNFQLTQMYVIEKTLQQVITVSIIVSYYNNIIQHNTTQRNTIQYNTIQYNTIECNAMQSNAIQYNATQY